MAACLSLAIMAWQAGVLRYPAVGRQERRSGMALRAMNTANTLTMLRFVMVPMVIVALVNESWLIAFVAFVTAGITDAVDGWVARRFDQRTELGAYLDPLADKALLVSIYITLAIEGLLPSWLAVLVVSRDIMIVGAVILAWVIDKPVEINPLKLSKANTFGQIGLAALKLGSLAFALEIDRAIAFGVYAIAALTVASMAAYLAAWFRHMAD
jgi:cardiolipin synthase (CMP-forming)